MIKRKSSLFLDEKKENLRGALELNVVIVAKLTKNSERFQLVFQKVAPSYNPALDEAQVPFAENSALLDDSE